jgi:hypothetical protein
MSNELSAQELLPPEIGLTLLGFEKSEQGWLIRAEGRTRHSRYWRHLQDLPVQSKEVPLRLRLSRWRLSSCTLRPEWTLVCYQGVPVN